MGVEELAAMEEFGMCQQQLHMHIAGVSDCQQVLPWREEQDGTTKYEQFTDGVVYRNVKGVARKVQEKTVIRKTVVNGTITERYHTIDYWENRKSARYVPLCQSLKANGLRIESRLFE